MLPQHTTSTLPIVISSEAEKSETVVAIHGAGQANRPDTKAHKMTATCPGEPGLTHLPAQQYGTPRPHRPYPR